MTTKRCLATALLAAGIAVMTGCGVPSNQPASYEDQSALSMSNFVSGCTGAEPIVNGTTTTISSSAVCQCDYAVFQNNVPYGDSDKTKSMYAGYSGKTFLEINNELKRDAAKFNDNTVIPQAVRDKLNNCRSDPTSATLPPDFPKGTGPYVIEGTTIGTGPGATQPPGSTPGSALR